MKTSQLIPTIAALAVLTSTASSAIVLFDISPLSFGDNTIGISGPNEVAPNPTTSTATGNEIGAGISLDTGTGLLTLNFAYGSAFGFVDLNGTYTDSHIHQGANDAGGGVVFGIGGLRTPSGAGSASYSGNSPVLSGAQQTALLNNLFYINIHSSIAGGGEIRGQIVQVPEPGSAMLLLSGATAVLGLRRRRS